MAHEEELHTLPYVHALGAEENRDFMSYININGKDQRVLIDLAVMQFSIISIIIINGTKKTLCTMRAPSMLTWSDSDSICSAPRGTGVGGGEGRGAMAPP